MDPATIGMILTGVSDLIGVAQQYSSGAITQDQALQQLQQAYANLGSAIDAFNKAASPTPPRG